MRLLKHVEALAEVFVVDGCCCCFHGQLLPHAPHVSSQYPEQRLSVSVLHVFTQFCNEDPFKEKLQVAIIIYNRYKITLSIPSKCRAKKECFKKKIESITL